MNYCINTQGMYVIEPALFRTLWSILKAIETYLFCPDTDSNTWTRTIDSTLPGIILMEVT